MKKGDLIIIKQSLALGSAGFRRRYVVIKAFPETDEVQILTTSGSVIRADTRHFEIINEEG